MFLLSTMTMFELHNVIHMQMSCSTQNGLHITEHGLHTTEHGLHIAEYSILTLHSVVIHMQMSCIGLQSSILTLHSVVIHMQSI